MAIGNNTGGSAASRFRPRGTISTPQRPAYTGSQVGDGNEGPTKDVEEDSASTAPQKMQPAPSSVQRPRYQRTVNEPQSEEGAQQTVSEANASDHLESNENSTPSSTAPTPKKRRGRKPKSTSTKQTATQNSPSDPSVVSSVTGARARMRELEQAAKELKAERDAMINVANEQYVKASAPLVTEYDDLTTAMKMWTFDA